MGYNKLVDMLGGNEDKEVILLNSITAAQQEELEEQLEKENVTSEISVNIDQVREVSKLDLNFLAGLAMPLIFQYPFSVVLITVWALLLQYLKIDGKDTRLALGIPRGFAKTTIVKLFILYCILFTKKKFILIIGSTESNAENILSDVMEMLVEDNILSSFGDWRFSKEKETLSLKKFWFNGRPITLYAIGAGTAIRGANVKNERPDVMIFEDIQTKECSESQVQSDALERWMIATAMKAKSPKGCMFIFVGNMYPGPHSILKKLKSNPNWIKFISGAILADGTSLWPDHRSVESLLDELDNDIAMGHPEIFFSEVLNDTEAAVNTKVNFSLFKEWSWFPEELPQGKFIIIDPSGDTAKSDVTAIGYVEVYDEKPGFRTLISEKLSPGNTIRKALLLALRTRTRVIAVESTAYQASLLYWFERIAEQLELTGFQFVPINTSGISKNSRIAIGIKALEASEIVLHPDVASAVKNQIANWNPLKKNNIDDILDLVAYIPKVLEKYPHAIISHEFDLIADSSQNGVLEDNHSF